MTAPQFQTAVIVADEEEPIQVSTNPTAQQPQYDIAPAGVPTRKELCQAIVKATQCSMTKAKKVVRLINDWLIRARQDPEGLCWPYGEELKSDEYTIFDAIVPHGATAAPGSVHAMLERYFLQDGEIGIRHDCVEDSGLEYCQVALQFGVVKVGNTQLQTSLN